MKDREFKRLSEVHSAKGIPVFSPVASPGCHCPMHSAVSEGSKVKGLSMLVVGSAECTYYSRGPSNRRKGRLTPDETTLSWAYMLSENETVFGCRDGLEKAINEMLDLGAEPLLVVATCIPQLIGDDIEGLCDEIADERGAKVFAISIPHYSCISTSKGISAFMGGMINVMDPMQKTPKRINVLGGGRGTAVFYEMTLLLESAGFNLLLLGSDNEIMDYITAASASFNLVCSPTGLELAVKMREKFGIEYVDVSSLLSPDEISAGFRMLEALPGVNSPDLSEQFFEIKKLEREVTEILSGKCFALGPGATQVPLRTASYLAGLGMVPAVLHIDELYPGELECRQSILDMGFDPIVAHMVYEPIDSIYIRQIGADIVLGSSGHGHNGHEDMLLGFERTIRLLDVCLRGTNGKGIKLHGSKSKKRGSR